MKRISKEERLGAIKVMGLHLERFHILNIVLFSIIMALEIAFIFMWFFDPTTVAYPGGWDYYYLATQFVHVAILIVLIVCFILNRKKIVKPTLLVIFIHIYTFLLMAWATSLCLLDLSIGLPPVIFLLIITMIAGLFVVEPRFYMAVTSLSLITIIIAQIIRKYPYFSGDAIVENIVNFIAFAFVVVVMSFRLFNVTMSEQKAISKLERLAHYDELTDLLNERSYIKETEHIDNLIKKGKMEEFAVVLMDVNNLKATNDEYGHRYGCSLIVRCGHMLPSLFPTSKIFHVGGDEFIAIIYGEDLINFEERMKNFDEKCRYSIVEYEGHNLIFSVARGYAIHKEGQLYKDVLQIADKAMYENKAEIKATYNMKSR